MSTRLGIVLSLVLLIPSVALAQSPPLIPVQGTLMDADGAAISGELDVDFALYGDAVGAAQIWTETQTLTFVQGGFVAYLGEGNTLNLSIFRDYSSIYLGIAVAGDPEMDLVQLATAPYAGFAVYCGDSASLGGVTVEQMLADVDDLVTTGTHERYTDAESVAAMGAMSPANPLNHERFAPSDVVASMGAVDPTNTLNHERYTDAEAVTAMGAVDPTNTLNHERYTDAEAVTAMGAIDPTNALNHERYTDAEAIAALDPHLFELSSQAGSNLVSNADMVDTSSWIEQADTVLMQLPDGRDGYVHEAVESGTSCYQWGRSNGFAVDPNKAYEYSIWIKTDGTDMNNYLGFFARDASGTAIGTPWNNPYFKTSDGDPNYWVRWTGYLLPAWATDADANGRPDTGSARTNGGDWVMPAAAVEAELRFGACYGDGANGNKSWFAFPSVREIPLEEAMMPSHSFIAPTYENGWVTYDGNYNPAGYYRDKEGTVHVRGMVKSGTIGTAVFTLPEGFRPAYRELQTCQTSPNASARCDVATNGQVIAYAGSNSWFSLDGITFKAAGY